MSRFGAVEAQLPSLPPRRSLLTILQTQFENAVLTSALDHLRAFGSPLEVEAPAGGTAHLFLELSAQHREFDVSQSLGQRLYIQEDSPRFLSDVPTATLTSASMEVPARAQSNGLRRDTHRRILELIPIPSPSSQPSVAWRTDRPKEC